MILSLNIEITTGFEPRFNNYLLFLLKVLLLVTISRSADDNLKTKKKKKRTKNYSNLDAKEISVRNVGNIGTDTF